MRIVLVALLTAAVLVPTAASASRGDASVAALQVALARQHLYGGTIDGMVAPATTKAVENGGRA
jgi:peptidoglycan hydrolase-like protein with peptidoglycan-binding domain